MASVAGIGYSRGGGTYPIKQKCERKSEWTLSHFFFSKRTKLVKRAGILKSYFRL